MGDELVLARSFRHIFWSFLVIIVVGVSDHIAFQRAKQLVLLLVSERKCFERLIEMFARIIQAFSNDRRAQCDNIDLVPIREKRQ